VNAEPGATLIHVGDPMCSWCYAFAPELRTILAETDLPIRVVMGGLFVGDRTVPLDASLRSYLYDTWGRVSEMSGQPVSYEKLSWHDWVYDTELACRAVVAARRRDETTALEVLDRLQAAFYSGDQDITNRDVLGSLLDFDVELDEPDLIAATRSDFAEAKSLGAHGFPTLLLDTGDEKITVAAGHVAAARVLRSVQVLLG